MKIGKRILSTALALVLAASALTMVPEREAKAAGTITAGNENTFTIKSGESQDYTYTMPEDGYFYFELKAEGARVNYKFVNNYKTYLDSSCSNGSSFVSSPYAFPKNSEVQFHFECNDAGYDFIEGKDIIKNCTYKLTINYVKSSNFEQESNDLKSDAGKIKKGKEYTSVMMADDTDWYVFKAPKKGTYKFMMVDTDTVTDYSQKMNIEIYGGSNKILGVSSITKGTGWTKVFQKKMKKGQKIYLKCTYDEGGFEYKIKVK